MTITYTNPRTHAVIDNWPSGSYRVTATFYIETHPKRGERAVRVTTGKPVKVTYATKARIVDGDDGRTYIATLNGHFVSILRGDMKYWHESIFPDNPRFAEVRALFTNGAK